MGSMKGVTFVNAETEEIAREEFKKQWKMLTITGISEDRPGPRRYFNV